MLDGCICIEFTATEANASTFLCVFPIFPKSACHFYFSLSVSIWVRSQPLCISSRKISSLSWTQVLLTRDSVSAAPTRVRRLSSTELSELELMKERAESFSGRDKQSGDNLKRRHQPPYKPEELRGINIPSTT
jgi:hypothetical protein